MHFVLSLNTFVGRCGGVGDTFGNVCCVRASADSGAGNDARGWNAPLCLWASLPLHLSRPQCTCSYTLQLGLFAHFPLPLFFAGCSMRASKSRSMRSVRFVPPHRPTLQPVRLPCQGQPRPPPPPQVCVHHCCRLRCVFGVTFFMLAMRYVDRLSLLSLC